MGADKESLGEKIHSSLKRRIIDLKTKPSEKSHSFSNPFFLEGEFEVNGTPIREALHRLKGDGLVEVKPRRLFITKITPDKIRNLHDLRVVFETYGL